MSNMHPSQQDGSPMVRVTAEQRKTMQGQTHWAHLIAEDKRENSSAPKHKP